MKNPSNSLDCLGLVDSRNTEPSGDNILLAGKLANNVSVMPGETKSGVGCIIKHVLTNDPQALVLSLVDLIHQFDNSQPVSMKRAQSDTSTAAVGTALPSTLQSLCTN
jgi:hypothetical protein